MTSTLWLMGLVMVAVWIVLPLLIGAWIGQRDRRRFEAWYAITVVKMHPNKEIREAAADSLIRRLLPELPAEKRIAASSAVTAK